MFLTQRWRIFDSAGLAEVVDRLEINATFATAAPVAKPTAGIVFSSLHNNFDATRSVACFFVSDPSRPGFFALAGIR